MAKTVTNREASAKITARLEFKGNNLSARIVKPRTIVSTGQLSGDDLTYFHMSRGRAESEGKSFYVVFSYSTPIAWYVEGESYRHGWTIPQTRYSVTTTRHQGIVRRAI